MTRADLFSIDPVVPYPDDYDGKLEVARNLPNIIYTFMEGYDFSGKTVIPFCTHADSGLPGTQNAVADSTGATMLDGLAVAGTTAQNDRDSAASQVHDWLKDGGFIE